MDAHDRLQDRLHGLTGTLEDYGAPKPVVYWVYFGQLGIKALHDADEKQRVFE